MIQIGTDIVAIERIRRMRALYAERFLRRFLHPTEIAAVHNDASIAGLWAAKEALSKALGCGIGAALNFHDIRIEKNKYGAPIVHFSKAVQDHFAIRESSLSISHDGGFAIAVAVIEYEPAFSGDH